MLCFPVITWHDKGMGQHFVVFIRGGISGVAVAMALCCAHAFAQVPPSPGALSQTAPGSRAAPQQGLGLGEAGALEPASTEATHIKALMAEAEKGNVKAQTEVANAYYVGIGVPKSLQEAIKWWRKAADLGDGSAFSLLGTMSYLGNGVPKDSAEAIRMWHKGAEKYDKDAMSQLGFAYLVGDSVPKDHTLSYMWFNLAASNGDVSAAKSRDSVAKNLSADMVMEAQRLGSEWTAQHPKPAAPAPVAATPAP